MNFRAWTEQREVRTIATGDGDGFLTVRAGDFVLVAVVKRWEDVAKLINLPLEPDVQPDER